MEHEQNEGLVEEDAVEFIGCVPESFLQVESVESEDDEAEFGLDEHLIILVGL